MKYFLYLIIVFFTYNSYCQVKPDSIEQKALNFVLNNLDSLPVYNINKNGQERVYYYLHKDSLKLSLFTGNSWKKKGIFNSDEKYIGKRNYYLNTSILIKNNAKKTSLNLTKFEQKGKKGDKYISISTSCLYMDNYYVMVGFYKNGDLTNCIMVIKFDTHGDFKKFVYQCGVE